MRVEVYACDVQGCKETIAVDKIVDSGWLYRGVDICPAHAKQYEAMEQAINEERAKQLDAFMEGRDVK